MSSHRGVHVPLAVLDVVANGRFITRTLFLRVATHLLVRWFKEYVGCYTMVWPSRGLCLSAMLYPRPPGAYVLLAASNVFVRPISCVCIAVSPRVMFIDLYVARFYGVPPLRRPTIYVRLVSLQPFMEKKPQAAARCRHFIAESIPLRCDRCHRDVVGPLFRCIHCPSFACCLECQVTASVCLSATIDSMLCLCAIAPFEGSDRHKAGKLACTSYTS